MRLPWSHLLRQTPRIESIAEQLTPSAMALQARLRFYHTDVSDNSTGVCSDSIPDGLCPPMAAHGGVEYEPYRETVALFRLTVRSRSENAPFGCRLGYNYKTIHLFMTG